MADQKKNPRNAASPLFKRLTRLLSGPLVNYRQQTPRQLRRRQLDKYKFKSASGQQFKKTEYNPFSSLQANYMVNQNRGDRYVDFDQMEFTPEIASALDIYADEMTTSSDLQPLLSIDCQNEEIKSILDSLYHNIMNIEFNLFGWCRSMCKFGDFFLYIDIDEQSGVKNVIGLPSHEVERLEGEDATNPNYIQYQWNSGGITFENWQIAHFRILGNDKYAPYGTSVLEPARRIWRQLILLEDAMMAYRIVRSPERRVFKIDVGNIPAPDVEQYMQKVMTQMKRNQVIDPDTGRVDLRYNPMSIDEDYFIPVRGGASSEITTLPGGTYTGDIDDVKYLRDKLFSALKVPQSYLSRGEGAEEDKTTLAQKDIRFARTIQRLQRSIVAELEKVGVIHLYTMGYRASDLVSFKLALNNPSKIAELQELESWRTKFDTAGAATEGFFSKRWVAKHIFKLSDEEFLRNQRDMFHDAKLMAALEAVPEQVASELTADAGGADAGMEGMEGGDEGAGMEGMEDLEVGGDEGGMEDMEEMPAEEPGGDDSALLAAPGSRDDDNDVWIKFKNKKGETTTSRSKRKKYKPRDIDARGMGARKKSMMGLAGHSQGGRKNLFKGYSDLSSLSRGVYTESQKSEEEKIFEVNQEIRNLIIELDTRYKVEQDENEA